MLHKENQAVTLIYNVAVFLFDTRFDTHYKSPCPLILIFTNHFKSNSNGSNLLRFTDKITKSLYMSNVWAFCFILVQHRYNK